MSTSKTKFYDLSKFREVPKMSRVLADYPTINVAYWGAGLNNLAYEEIAEFEGYRWLWDAEDRAVIIEFFPEWRPTRYRVQPTSHNLSIPRHIREAFGIGDEPGLVKRRRFRLTRIDEGFYFAESDELDVED